MQDLIERLTKATGPDRELDALIAVALDIRPDWLKGAKGEMWIDLHCGIGEPAIRFQDERMKRGSGNPPIGGYARYTSSIDAALTLVPPDFDWCVGTDDDTPIAALNRPHERPWDWNSGPTPAIALCIAALKARMALP